MASSVYKWFFNKLEEQKKENNFKKDLIKSILVISIFGILIYELVIDLTLGNFIYLVAYCVILYLIDLISFFKNKISENELKNERQYLDLKNSLDVIKKSIIYESGAWYSGGRWDSDKIKSELQVDKWEKYWDFKLTRDLSEFEMHLWMLYINSNNYIFCGMLTHLLRDGKVHLSYINKKDLCAIIMDPIEKGCGCDYNCDCPNRARIEPIVLIEPEDKFSSENISHRGTLKEYTVNDSRWIYWDNLIIQTINVLTTDATTQAVDLEKRTLHADPMGYFTSHNLVYEIFNRESRELEQETNVLRNDLEKYFSQ